MALSRKILASAVLASLGVVAIAAISIAPFHGSARAYSGDQPGNVAEQRIAAAFASVPGVRADPALLELAESVRKGDLMVRPGCRSEKWPNISADCLVSGDGSLSRPVRTVTIGYQAGQATTVLMRIPADQVASR